MRRWTFVGLLLARWGFAALVATAIGIGFVVALGVTPPTDVPAVALRAASVYRVEVGAVVFLGLYLATMAFALALQNRGFTEIGSSGVRAQDLATAVERVASEDASMELLTDLIEEVDDLRAWRERSEVVS
jgi:hypothetical protein